MQPSPSPRSDVGLYTNQREAMLEFWQGEIGVPFDELLPAGRGVHQLRHRIGDSILKINHVREPMVPAPASGYRRLTLARPGIESTRHLVDPDGNAVKLVPPDHRGVTQIEIELAARDPARTIAFYRDALALPEVTPGRFRCGVSLIAIVGDPDATPDPVMRATGYRYTTIRCQAQMKWL